MRVWVFNHYASTPDQPTTGSYFLLKSMADKGVDVTVFASGFNYYSRKDIRMQGNYLTRADVDGKLTFQWIRTTPTKGGAVTRLINMLSYATLAFFVAVIKREKPDIVIGVCPHPFAGLTAWMVSVFKRARFVYEIRDIWPESLTEGKIASNKHPLIIFFTHLQKFLYRRAEKIISVIGRLDLYLAEIGIDPKKFVWAPNGIIIDRAALPAPSGQPESPDGIFNVMYIGGHSKYHALEDILDAAALVQNQTNIHFILIGDGSEKIALIERAKALGLKNLEFRDAVPRTEIINVVKEASCFVISSRTMPIHRYGISPNKLSDSMLAGRPTILAIPIAGDMITGPNAGYVIESKDPQALADAILRMERLPASEREAMGARAQAYALDTFDAGALADRVIKALSA